MPVGFSTDPVVKFEPSPERLAIMLFAMVMDALENPVAK